MTKPSRQTIVTSLRSGDRHVINDADEVNDTGAFNIEAIHRGRNGSVVVQFNFDGAYENTTAGQVASFDLLEEDSE